MSATLKYKPTSIKLDVLSLQGNLIIPEKAVGVVVFSHGSGSSRWSPRNKYVAEVLQRKGMATLLFDLLSKEEDKIYENRFNIDLLTERLIEVTQWVQQQEEVKNLPIGYFGASTGAASALRAASHFGHNIKAVVSRGGRPDMAMQELDKLTSPTLLIVGGWDNVVIELNKKAYQKMRCRKKLEIIPNASHLFEEPGTLEEVAQVSANWFSRYFSI